jgi:BlaI family penicillinase repressor
MVKKKDTDLYESEWAILRVVWERQPITAPDVQEALRTQKAWAYTTVKTLMDRMTKKGLLKVQRIRNLYLYRASISKTTAMKREVKRTLRRAFDGAFTPMMQFLVDNEQLSEDEFSYLERLVEQRKNKEAR